MKYTLVVKCVVDAWDAWGEDYIFTSETATEFYELRDKILMNAY